MRANRTYGSEGGEGNSFPTPISSLACAWKNGGRGRPPSCVREFALSAKWESLPCEAMTHEAEGNCVAAVEE